MRWVILLLGLAVAVGVGARADDLVPGALPMPKTDDPVAPPTQVSRGPRIAEQRVLFTTTEGDLIFDLYPDVAPSAVAQFLKLVQAGVYEHTAFSFVDPGYYLQVGTIADRLQGLTDEQAKLVHPIKSEYAGLTHKNGTLSLSLINDAPNSSVSSFSILRADAPHLDGKSVIFGQVAYGMDVLAKLEKYPRSKDLQPLQRIEVIHAEVLSASAAKSRGELATLIATNATSLKFCLWAFFVVACVSILSFFVRAKVQPRVLFAFNLVNALVALFALFVLYTPQTRTSPILGGGIFMGMLGLFKLMNRFEST